MLLFGPRNFRLQWDEFCKENASVVMQKENHGLNRNVLYAWKDRMLNVMKERKDLDDKKTKGNVIEWIHRFTKQLTSISTDEFMQRLERICHEIIDMIPKGALVVLELDEEELRKSGFWVSVISWKILQSKVTHVFRDRLETDVFIESNPEKDIFLIVMDDASYSGDQYAESMMAEMRPSIDEAVFCVAAPYISRAARIQIQDKYEAIGKRENLYFPRFSHIFYELYQPAFDEDEDDDNEDSLRELSGPSQKLWRYYFNALDIPNRHVLFFNHKLPDQISTYTSIIQYAPVVSSTSNDIQDITFFGNGGLLENCPHSLNDERDLDKRLVLKDLNSRCPKPIYKTFPYKYHGHLVENHQLFELFVRTCISCNSRCQSKIFVCGGIGCSYTPYCSDKCAEKHWIQKHHKQCGK